jgi:predicted RNA-binding Zn-ribbon protein involved in translation (DUF1610 family)
LQRENEELRGENRKLNNRLVNLDEILKVTDHLQQELREVTALHTLQCEESKHLKARIEELTKQTSKPSGEVSDRNLQKPVCPYCGSEEKHRNVGVRSGKRRWQCRDCGKSFSVPVT